MIRAHNILAAAALACALPACGQWSPAIWTGSAPVAAWVWTNAAGTAMTGTVKDGRSEQMRRALLERYTAANQATSGVPSPAWYIWERANLVALKEAASNALEFYVDAPGLTNDCPAIPTMTGTGIVARLGLVSNFWTYTPWRMLGDETNRYGWRRLHDVINAMTCTVAAVDWRSHGVTNLGGTLADPSGEGLTWAAALADLPAATLQGVFDNYSPQAWVFGFHDDTYVARYLTGFADATNAAPLSAMSKAGALWWSTTFESVENIYDTIAFDAAGLDIASNAWRRIVAPTNIGAATAYCAPAIGPATLARPHDGIEPVNNTTWRGFISTASAIYYWTADPDGFKYR